MRRAVERRPNHSLVIDIMTTEIMLPLRPPVSFSGPQPQECSSPKPEKYMCTDHTTTVNASVTSVTYGQTTLSMGGFKGGVVLDRTTTKTYNSETGIRRSLRIIIVYPIFIVFCHGSDVGDTHGYAKSGANSSPGTITPGAGAIQGDEQYYTCTDCGKEDR
jgi:hypothetical protein